MAKPAKTASKSVRNLKKKRTLRIGVLKSHTDFALLFHSLPPPALRHSVCCPQALENLAVKSLYLLAIPMYPVWSSGVPPLAVFS